MAYTAAASWGHAPSLGARHPLSATLPPNSCPASQQLPRPALRRARGWGRPWWRAWCVRCSSATSPTSRSSRTERVGGGQGGASPSLGFLLLNPGLQAPCSQKQGGGFLVCSMAAMLRGAQMQAVGSNARQACVAVQWVQRQLRPMARRPHPAICLVDSPSPSQSATPHCPPGTSCLQWWTFTGSWALRPTLRASRVRGAKPEPRWGALVPAGWWACFVASQPELVCVPSVCYNCSRRRCCCCCGIGQRCCRACLTVATLAWHPPLCGRFTDVGMAWPPS